MISQCMSERQTERRARRALRGRDGSGGGGAERVDPLRPPAAARRRARQPGPRPDAGGRRPDLAPPTPRRSSPGWTRSRGEIERGERDAGSGARRHPHERREPPDRARSASRAPAAHRAQPQRPGRDRPAALCARAPASRWWRPSTARGWRCAGARASTPRRCCPGYTHLQRAQAVTLGHHLLAYAEMLGRDRGRLARRRAARRRVAARLGRAGGDRAADRSRAHGRGARLRAGRRATAWTPSPIATSPPRSPSRAR